MRAFAGLRRGLGSAFVATVLAVASGVAQAADVAPKGAPQPWPVSSAMAVPMFGDFFLDNDGLVRRGTFKIAENESPRPMDRIFYNYNHFSDVNRGNLFNNEQL